MIRVPRPAAIGAAALLAVGQTLAGCQTLGGRAPAYTEIVTTPPGATVTIENYGQCESPCRISHDARRRITVAKAGYVKQTFDVLPNAGEVRVILELAAPSEKVEETTLPEL